MSGRKASEVNSLLGQAAKARTNSINILDDVYNKVVLGAKKVENEIDEVKKLLEGEGYSISKAAEEEFVTVAEDLKKEYEKLKEKVKGTVIQVDDAEFSKLKSEYTAVDEEAETVKAAVNRKIKSQGRTDPWYCDAEFSQARKVQSKYNGLALQTNTLKNNYSGEVTKNNLELSKLEECKKQAKKLKKMIDDLNKRAEDIQKMRAEASKARNELQAGLDAIDKNVAKKFMNMEYEALVKTINQGIELKDEELVTEVSSLFAQLDGFTNALQVVYSQYLEKRTLAETSINSINDRINAKVYSNPEDEYKKGEKTYFSLIEFMEKNGRGNIMKQIQDELNNCKEYLDKDDFEGVARLCGEIVTVVNNASNEASQIHENRMKTIETMLHIKKAMLELDYDVKVQKNASGDDGYCISCTAGDECIEFDKVTVVDDGKPVITIDHKEATNGTCAASWHDIRRKLSDEGVFVEDITKNGRSIHAANHLSGKKAENTNVTQVK